MSFRGHPVVPNDDRISNYQSYDWWSSLSPLKLNQIAQTRQLRNVLYQTVSNSETFSRTKRLCIEYLIMTMNKTNYLEDLYLLSTENSGVDSNNFGSNKYSSSPLVQNYMV